MIHVTSAWHLSEATAGAEGGWACGLQPDRQHESGSFMNPEPLGKAASVQPPDPALYDTYDGIMGEPWEPVMGNAWH